MLAGADAYATYRRVLKTQFDALELFVRTLPTVGDDDVAVFDLDETVVENLAYFEGHEGLFSKSPFSRDTNMTPLIEESAGVFRAMRDVGLRHVFLTGRRERIRALTEANLALLGLDAHDALVMCPDEFGGTMAEFKAAARADLVAAGRRVVCTVGDQVADVAGDHAGARFLMFNPFYTTP